jgi:hypothetical protein
MRRRKRKRKAAFNGKTAERKVKVSTGSGINERTQQAENRFSSNRYLSGSLASRLFSQSFFRNQVYANLKGE